MRSLVLEFLGPFSPRAHLPTPPTLGCEGAATDDREPRQQLPGLPQGGLLCPSFAQRHFHFLPLMLLRVTVMAQKPCLRKDISLHVERPEPHG